MRKIAFYGGSFDPIHNGHMTIARRLVELFALDEFVFIPAFHAPHKRDRQPSSGTHRFAMLALATRNDARIAVSTIELDAPEKPFTIETVGKLLDKFPFDRLFFVIGADSWEEITTWREWETLLQKIDFIVVTRPHYVLETSHVSPVIRDRVKDLRDIAESDLSLVLKESKERIYFTDVVEMDISATEIRQAVSENNNHWREKVPSEAAEFIEKYDLYKVQKSL